MPEATPLRLWTSAPDSSWLESSRNASKTRSVWKDMRTLRSRLPILESLYRVSYGCKRPSEPALDGRPRYREPAVQSETIYFVRPNVTQHRLQE